MFPVLLLLLAEMAQQIRYHGATWSNMEQQIR
jgi:hypothetical protein